MVTSVQLPRGPQWLDSCGEPNSESPMKMGGTASGGRAMKKYLAGSEAVLGLVDQAKTRRSGLRWSHCDQSQPSLMPSVRLWRALWCISRLRTVAPPALFW